MRLKLTIFCLFSILLLTFITSRAQSAEVHYGETVNGTLATGGSQDWFFTAARGDLVGIDVKRTAGNLLPSMNLLDPDQQVIVGAQATPEQGSLSVFSVRIAQPGVYTIRLGSSAGTSGDYTLTLNNAAPTTTLPTVTPITQTVAGTLQYGQTMRGTISNAVYEQRWHFKGSIGDVIDIRMIPVSGTLDPFISLLSPANDVITTNDTANGGKDAAIYSRQLITTGTYTIVARRSGASQGQSGLTTGDYELTVTVHTPNGGEQNTPLNIGAVLNGRLTTAAPLAEYRLSDGGLLVFTLDLASLHRLARVRILDSSSTVVAEREGTSPLTFSAALPDKNTYSVQVSSDIFDNQSYADFTLSAYKLSAPAKVLHFFDPQRGSVGSAGSAGSTGNTGNTANTEERWFFTAHAGDIIRLGLKSQDGALDATVFVVGPQDVVLFRGGVGTQLDQPLTLPSDGVYQVMVMPANSLSKLAEYVIEAQWFGANGIPFERFGVAKPKDVLAFDKPVTGKLTDGEVDSWTLDAAADQVVSLTLAGSSSTQPVGVVVRAPDESLVGVQYGQGFALLRRVRLPRAGRYHVIVFDPTGSAKDPYTLQIEDAGGGTLTANQSVKGVLLPSNAYAEWALDAPAGALINVRLSTRTPASWTPGIYAVDPAGYILARANVSADRTTIHLSGISAPLTGRYRLIVAGTLSASFASYELVADVERPFEGASIQAQPQPPPTVPRFASTPEPAPLTIAVAELIEPPLPPEKLSGPDVLSLPANTLARGEIVPGALRQVWRISAQTNNTLSIQATALTGDVPPDLTLLDRDAKIVAQALHGDALSTVLTYHVLRGGDYVLSVRMGLNSGRYTLFLSTPAIRSGALSVARGTPMLYGQSLAGELLLPDQADAYYFLGALNDVISVRVWRTVGDLAPSLQLITPSGKALATDSNSDAQPNSTLANIRLSEAGMYAIRVKHADTKTATAGRYLLYLGVVSRSRTGNHLNGILNSGETVNGALSLADGEHTWLIQGHAGESISLAASALDSFKGPTPLSVRLQDTAGNTFAEQDALLSQDVAQLSHILLPADGIYRVQISGGTQTQGGYRLTWLPEREPLTPGPLRYAQTVSGLFTAARNAENWTFSGTANDVIAISLRQLGGQPFKGGFQLISESGVRLATAADAGDGSGAHVEGILLPFSGSYTIIALNPDVGYQGAGVYALNIVLQDSKARSMGGTLRDGSQGTGDLYPDDLVDTWLFKGRTGDVVNVQVQARDQFLKPVLKLQNASGQVLITANPESGGSAAVHEFKLPADGVYVVSIEGANSSTGSYRVGLNFVQPPVPDIALIKYGDTAVGLVADDRVEDLHVFNGSQGDTITARVTREPGSPFAAVLELRTAQDQLLARADALGQDDAIISNFVLPENGQYKLVATRFLGTQGRTAGRFNLSLTAQPANYPTRGKLRSGQRGIGRVDDATPAERWTLDGKTGEVFEITSHASSGDLDTFLTLVGPAGEIIASNDDYEGTDAVLPGVVLPADGAYTVILSRVGTRSRGSAGNYEIRADRLYTLGKLTTPQAIIAYGQRVVGIVDSARAEMRWTFAGNGGDEIAIQLAHPIDEAPPSLSIQDPGGSILASGKRSIGQTTIDRYRLPANGFFELVVKRPSNAQLAYTPYALTLTLLSSPLNSPSEGGTVQPNDSLGGRLNSGAGANYWLLKGSAGQSLSLQVLLLTGNLMPSVLLIDPGGQALINQTITPGASSVALDDVPLSIDGIYTLVVTSGGAERAGTYRLSTRSTFSTNPQMRPIIAGQNVQGSLNDIHSAERWQFFAKKGSSISARMLTSSGDLQPILQLLSADGQILASSRLDRTPLGSAAVLDSGSLPADGSYLLLAARAEQTSGSYILSFDSTTLSTQILTAKAIRYEQTVQGVVQGGQPATWVFEGNAGDAINAVTLPGANGDAPAIELQDAAGRSLAHAVSMNKEGNLQGFVLPADGRYLIALNSPATTTYTLTLQRRQNMLLPSQTGRTLVPGTTLENGIVPSALIDSWTFSGKAGDAVQITAKRTNCCLRLDMSIYGPNGFVGSATADPNSNEITFGPARLPNDGSYLVVIGRWLGAAGKSSGRYSILLSTVDESQVQQVDNTVRQAVLPTPTATSDPKIQSGATNQGDVAVGRGGEGYLSADQFAHEWTFSAGHSPTIAVTLKSLSAGLRASALIVRADGTLIGRAEPDANNANSELQFEAALPGEGRYSLLIVPDTPGQQGRYQFTLSYALAPTGGGRLIKAQTVSGTISDGDFTDCWRLEATAEESLNIDLTRLTGDLDTDLTLIAPDGSVTFSAAAKGGPMIEATNVRLPQSGTYLLLVSRRGGATTQTTGDYQLQVK